MRACWALSSVHLADARALTLLVLRDCPHLFDAAAGQPLLAPAPAGPPAGGPPGAAATGAAARRPPPRTRRSCTSSTSPRRRAPGLAALTKLRALDLSANARLRRLPAGVAALSRASVARARRRRARRRRGGRRAARARARAGLRRAAAAVAARRARRAGRRGSLALPPGVATALARLEVRGLGGGAVASGAACVGGPAGNVNTTAPLKPCGATPPQVVNLGGASRFDPPLPPLPARAARAAAARAARGSHGGGGARARRRRARGGAGRTPRGGPAAGGGLMGAPGVGAFAGGSC